MKNKKNSWNYNFKHQTIDDKLISSLMVRIFPLKTAKTFEISSSETCLTDGTKNDSIISSDYSYLIINYGIQERLASAYWLTSYNVIDIKIYITSEFRLDMLDKYNFSEKKYVLEALKKYLQVDMLLRPLKVSGFIGCLEKATAKTGDNFQSVYNTLITLAQNGNIDKVDELMLSYDIPCFYQAVFWKELYRSNNHQTK